MSKIINPEKINLKNNPAVTEEIIKQAIIDDPSILGLGDLELRDTERSQPRAGRLDLLLQDPDTKRRYEVEIQLGDVDESHIIRTIEYWDIEKKRYPQYEHCAVIVAENIASRFLNVISLFNGHIPLIAIKMGAFKMGEDVALNCVTVLDEVSLGLIDEDEKISEPTDRNYWIERSSVGTVEMADELLQMFNELSGQKFELNYTKHYIGLKTLNGRPDNIVIFCPKRKSLNIEIRLPRSEEAQNLINEAELDDRGYNYERYQLRLIESDIEDKKDVLKNLLQRAYENSK